MTLVVGQRAPGAAMSAVLARARGPELPGTRAISDSPPLGVSALRLRDTLVRGCLARPAGTKTEPGHHSRQEDRLYACPRAPHSTTSGPGAAGAPGEGDPRGGRHPSLSRQCGRSAPTAMPGRRPARAGGQAAVAGAVLLVLLAAGAEAATQASSPGPGVTSTYGRTCSTTHVISPNSTQELAEAIAGFAKAAAARRVHIRATHRLYHSTASFPCAAATAGAADLPPSGGAGGGAGGGGDSGGGAAAASAAVTVDVLTGGMDRVLSSDAARRTLTVGAGMTVTRLKEAAAAAGMSLPLMAVPNYGGLTLGGIIATAATGSGAGALSSLCDTMLEITWVDGRGEVLTSRRDSADGRAICGGLGVTGVVAELKVQLAPPTKVLVVSRMRQPDTRLVDDIAAMLKITPHVVVTWRPDLRLYTAYMFSKSDSAAPANATIYRIDRPVAEAQLLGSTLAAWQSDVFSLNPLLTSTMCAFVAPVSSVDTSWAVDPKTEAPVSPALADANDILSGTCRGGDGQCSLTTVGNIGVNDIHFTIDRPSLRRWVDDVKSVIARDLQGAPPAPASPGGAAVAGALPLAEHVAAAAAQKECLAPGYFWIRFGKPTDDYVGLNAAPYAEPVHVQLSLFKSRAAGVPPMKHLHVLSTIEQLTLCSYNGRPHWGKNFDRTFTYSRCPVSARYPGWASWLAAAKQHDPRGLFASPLVDTVLRNGSYSAYPGCGVTGGCYCETDEHCLLAGLPAAQGWKCVPSVAFPAFKSCRPLLLN